jgi:hypothetical protein
MKLFSLRFLCLLLIVLACALETPRGKIFGLLSGAWIFVEESGDKAQLEDIPAVLTPDAFYGHPAISGFMTADGHKFFFDGTVAGWRNDDGLSWSYVGDGKLRISNHRTGESVMARYAGVERQVRGY